MGKPPKMRKGNGRVTEREHVPKVKRKRLIAIHAVMTRTATVNFDSYNKVRCGAGGNRTPDPLLAKQVL